MSCKRVWNTPRIETRTVLMENRSFRRPANEVGYYPASDPVHVGTGRCGDDSGKRDGRRFTARSRAHGPLTSQTETFRALRLPPTARSVPGSKTATASRPRATASLRHQTSGETPRTRVPRH